MLPSRNLLSLRFFKGKARQAFFCSIYNHKNQSQKPHTSSSRSEGQGQFACNDTTTLQKSHKNYVGTQQTLLSLQGVRNYTKLTQKMKKTQRHTSASHTRTCAQMNGNNNNQHARTSQRRQALPCQGLVHVHTRKMNERGT